MSRASTDADGGLAPKIVEAIADVEGVDPAELDYSPHEFVPQRAIDLLYRWEGAHWTLTCVVADHEVRVDNGGTVVVDGRTFR